MGWRIGVIFGVSRLVENSHVIVQRQENIFRHYRVQQTRSRPVQNRVLKGLFIITSRDRRRKRPFAKPDDSRPGSCVS